MILPRLIALLLMLLLTTVKLSAQEIRQVHHLSPAEGLTSGKYNNYIHQDRRNYVWISSTLGMNRFDGTHLRRYRHETGNPKSLITDNSAQSRIMERPNGDLFFTNYTGFSRYNRATDDYDYFQIVTADGDTLNTLYFWCYLSAEDEYLFVSTSGGLYLVDPDTPDQNKLIDPNMAMFKDRMLELGESRFALARFRGESPVGDLTTYDLNTDTLGRRPFRTPTDVSINDLQFIGPDTLVFATEEGVMGYAPESGDWWDYPGTSDLSILEIELYGEEVFYLATRAGVIYRYERTTARLDPLLNNNGGGVDTFRTDIERMSITPDSTLWVSTVGSGVYYTSLRRQAFEYLRWGLPNRSANVKGIAVTVDGVYVLFPGYVVYRTKNSIKYIDLPVNGTGGGEPSGIFLDAGGRLWVSTFTEMYYLDKGALSFNTFEVYDKENNRFRGGFFAPSYLPDGKLLLPANRGESYQLDTTTGGIEPWLTGVNRITQVVFNDAGNGIVVTGEGGVYLISTSAGKVEVDRNLRKTGLVNGLAYDRENDWFWLGTASGLRQIQYKKGGWTTRGFPEEEKLSELNISSLALGHDGVVWFTTASRIWQFLPKTGELRYFGLSDGLQGTDFNSTATALGPDGALWLGGTSGINRLSALKEEGNGQVVISSIVIDGKPRAYRDYLMEPIPEEDVRGLKLPFELRDVELGVTAKDYKDSKSVDLWYSVVGGEWEGRERRLREDGNIDFFNLTPGIYRIKVRGTDSRGRQLGLSEPFKLTITPPWYRAWWFYVLLFLAFVIFLLDQYRRQRKYEREKLASANARREATERELAMLRLQMDPHFVSNSLVSVQEFLQIGDPDEAEAYLVLFSRLIREVLERSVHPLTRLEDALDWLRRYVALEEKRLDAPLKFMVEGEESVDAYETWIPTMILQPFVENSILHGIGNRASGGMIMVRYFPQEQGRGLVLEIEDNGRGRGCKEGGGEHTSMATEITRRRLRLLEEDKHALLPSTAPASAPLKSGMEILDLQDEMGNASGTRVVIKLPWLTATE